MPSRPSDTPRGRPLARARAALSSLRRAPGILVGLLLLIWVALPLLPQTTGLRFGVGFRAFFTIMLLLGAVFFWFLGKERIPRPRGSMGVMASLTAVCLATVGILVVAGVVYPQFQLPQPPAAAAQEAAERGKELFWGASVGCFRCHAVGGKGGTRGPELTQVASRASQRVQGLSAERYLFEKIHAGATYEFKVPEYVPMMPPFGQIISEEQIRDLVAYLLSLE